MRKASWLLQTKLGGKIGRLLGGVAKDGGCGKEFSGDGAANSVSLEFFIT